MEAIANELATAGVRTSRGGEFGAIGVRQILSHAHLYRTGERIWAGIRAAARWPVTLDGEEQPQ